MPELIPAAVVDRAKLPCPMQAQSCPCYICSVSWLENLQILGAGFAGYAPDDLCGSAGAPSSVAAVAGLHAERAEALHPGLISHHAAAIMVGTTYTAQTGCA